MVSGGHLRGAGREVPAMTIPWWHKTTVYQIYPRSFRDTNGDGIGDLRGIMEKLDYVRDLGFETIWISPFYPSPLADHGYDITDYDCVAPEYGTMQDFEELLEAAHRRGLKVLLDMVLSHTSDQHPWFLESRQSRNNAKSDWYIWRDGSPSRPPNNWVAFPGGGAWHYAAERGQWYMASFLPFQPDLNWRNPEVKQAMFDVVRRGLRRGVDGFRLDLFSALMKDAQFRDNPFQPGLYDGGMPSLRNPCMQHNHPDIFPFCRELRNVMREFGEPERILLGEAMGDKREVRQLLGGGTNDGLNLAFLFDMIFLLPWQRRAKWFHNLVAEFEQRFPPPFQPTYVFGNHDMRRLMGRIGGDMELAKMLAVFQLTARGVPTVYMGEEIGMTDLFIPKSQAQDPVSKLWGRVPDAVRKWLPINLNRDMNRTPMQWTGGANAGFCSPDAVPWLPVNEQNKHQCNVEHQAAAPQSLLNLYKALLKLRRETPALHAGSLTLLDRLPANVFGYVRRHDSQSAAILLNFGKRAAAVPLDDTGELALSTAERVRVGQGAVTVPGRAAAIVLLGANIRHT